MRQGQQHRRGRSRSGQGNHGHSNHNNNNNNRKGQNPISRSYQSNGPDGKVSGTAASIAEKYLSLARDAHSSGDPVLAENYLQHAEHYNRIILAYRETLAQGEDGSNGGGRQRQGQPGETAEESEDAGEDEVESYGRDMQPLPPMESAQPRGNDQQPRIFEGVRQEGQRGEGNREGNRDGNRDGNRFDDRQPRFNDQQRRQQRDRFEPRERYGADRGERFNNGNNSGGGERFNGGQRGDRYQNDRSGERQPQQGDRQPRDPGFGDRGARDGGHVRQDAAPREPAFQPPITAEPAAVVREEPAIRAPRPPRRPAPAATVVSEHEQPEFLRRPVRRPRREAAADEVPPAGGSDHEPSES